jgi:membrane-associated phospholipid phosphatase
MPDNKRTAFFPVDFATWGYLIILSLIVIIFRRNQADWRWYILFDFLVFLLIFLIVKFFEDKPKTWSAFFRHWYPVFLFTILYEQTRYLIHLIFNHWFDPWINSVEFKLFGTCPTIWFQKIASVPLNEYMMFSYFSYYFLMPITGASLYFTGKVKEFDQMVFAAAVAFYISYLGFIFFPVQGPRYQLADFYYLKLAGMFFAPLAQFVVKVGGLHGGCMPSSHVAVALVVLIYCIKYQKRLAWFLGPLIISLFVATIYGRFHYFSDVVVGLLIGFLSYLFCERVYRKKSVNSPVGTHMGPDKPVIP